MGLSGQLDTGTQIDGGTDNTTIGNVGDRLKVDVVLNSDTTNSLSWSRYLRYVDMNVASGGIARNTNVATSTSWTTAFSYSGSGYLAALILNLESFSDWEMKLLVDGDIIFQLLANEVTGDAIYDLDDNGNTWTDIGLSKSSHDRLIWKSPLDMPLRYSSSVIVQIRRPTAGAKKFQAGLVILSKET